MKGGVRAGVALGWGEWMLFVSSPRRFALFPKDECTLVIPSNPPVVSSESGLTDGVLHMSVGCWRFFLSNIAIYVAPLWPICIFQFFWDFCWHDSATQNSKDMFLFYFYALKTNRPWNLASLAENIVFFLTHMLIIRQAVRRKGHFPYYSRLLCYALGRQNIRHNFWLIYIDLNGLFSDTSYTGTFWFNWPRVHWDFFYINLVISTFCKLGPLTSLNQQPHKG